MYNKEVVRVLMKRQKGIHPCFITAVALDPRFKHMQGCGIHPNEVETIWEKVLQLMIIYVSKMVKDRLNLFMIAALIGPVLC